MPTTIPGRTPSYKFVGLYIFPTLYDRPAKTNPKTSDCTTLRRTISGISRCQNPSFCPRCQKHHGKRTTICRTNLGPRVSKHQNLWGYHFPRFFPKFLGSSVHLGPLSSSLLTGTHSWILTCRILPRGAIPPPFLPSPSRPHLCASDEHRGYCPTGVLRRMGLIAL